MKNEMKPKDVVALRKSIRKNILAEALGYGGLDEGDLPNYWTGEGREWAGPEVLREIRAANKDFRTFMKGWKP